MLLDLACKEAASSVRKFKLLQSSAGYALNCDDDGSCSTLQGDQLVVYGGERGVWEKVDRPEAQANENEERDDEDDDAEPISDVCQLDVQSNYWVILPMEGETKTPLPARTGPTITAMPDGRGLVFGRLARF